MFKQFLKLKWNFYYWWKTAQFYTQQIQDYFLSHTHRHTYKHIQIPWDYNREVGKKMWSFVLDTYIGWHSHCVCDSYMNSNTYTWAGGLQNRSRKHTDRRAHTHILTKWGGWSRLCGVWRHGRAAARVWKAPQWRPRSPSASSAPGMTQWAACPSLAPAPDYTHTQLCKKIKHQNTHVPMQLHTHPHKYTVVA